VEGTAEVVEAEVPAVVAGRLLLAGVGTGPGPPVVAEEEQDAAVLLLVVVEEGTAEEVALLVPAPLPEETGILPLGTATGTTGTGEIAGTLLLGTTTTTAGTAVALQGVATGTGALVGVLLPATALQGTRQGTGALSGRAAGSVSGAKRKIPKSPGGIHMFGHTSALDMVCSAG